MAEKISAVVHVNYFVDWKDSRRYVTLYKRREGNPLKFYDDIYDIMEDSVTPTEFIYTLLCNWSYEVVADECMVPQIGDARYTYNVNFDVAAGGTFPRINIMSHNQVLAQFKMDDDYDEVEEMLKWYEDVVVNGG